MNMIAKAKEHFLKIWRDPVWSKVIAAGILGAIALLWAKLTNHSWKEIYYFIISSLSFKLPVFLFLSVFALYFIIAKCIQLLKKRKDAFWNEQMGNYTFKELYNILLTTTMPVSTNGMKVTGRQAPNDNFLLLFRVYYTALNTGVGIEDNMQDSGYLYSVFAPQMVGFGLVEVYQKPDNNLPEVSDNAYRTSELGHRFHASLNKLILADRIKELKKEGKI
jgi:hypothetical protein